MQQITCIAQNGWTDPVAIGTLVLAVVTVLAIIVPIMQRNGEAYVARESAIEQAYHALSNMIAIVRMLRINQNANASSIIEDASTNRAVINSLEVLRELPPGYGPRLLRALSLTQAAVRSAVIREALPGGLLQGNRFAERQADCEAALNDAEPLLTDIDALRHAPKPSWLKIRFGIF